jgi:hypothetical protein
MSVADEDTVVNIGDIDEDAQVWDDKDSQPPEDLQKEDPSSIIKCVEFVDETHDDNAWHAHNSRKLDVASTYSIMK